jgi:hypothetical protein
MAENAVTGTEQAALSGAATAEHASAVQQAEPVPAQPRVKIRKHKQRSCNEKDAKGKLCAGHLKHWYDYPPEIAALVGANAEIYRCEFCKTLYRPDPAQLPNSFTVRY